MALKESNKNRKKVIETVDESETYSYNTATHLPRKQEDTITLKQLKYITIGVGVAILALLFI